MRQPARAAGALLLLACALAGHAADAPAAGNTSLLPEDKSRALVIRTCAVCHPPELLVTKKRTIETWDRLISKMIDYGARADDDQQVEILTYFATYFLGTDTSIGAPAPASSPASTPAK